MRDNRLSPSAHFTIFLSSARFNTVAGFFTARLRRLLLRQAICIALIFSLLFLPGSSYAFAQAPEIASTLVRISTLPIAPISGIIRKLFSPRTQIRRKETIDDRARAVARLVVSPNKRVGYQGEGATFTALPIDALGNTVQGVRVSWSSSNTQKVEIDEAGRARFLQPGLAWINASVGPVTGTAPVLVRPNHRGQQTDDEWRIDQGRLRLDGSQIGEARPAEDERPVTGDENRSGLGAVFGSLLDKLAPTALAQNGGSSDLAYDQLWSEPRNWVGSPPGAAADSMAFGSVLPEGSNFTWPVSIAGLGGRGLATGLTLYYNSRVWSRRNNSVAYDAISGWPAPGFSIGFGRIVPYEIGTGFNPTCKYLLIEADGTRRYLGSGAWAGFGYALGGPFETSDGSHIVYTGNARDGGDLHYPDGTVVSYTTTNNRVLPTTISDRNGNYVQIAYKPDCFEQGGQTYCGVFSPIAIDYVIDTLGRRIEFQYDSSYRLISITTPGFGGSTQNPLTNTLVQFDYQTVSATGTFSGLTVERAAGSITTLKHIFFPATGTGYLPAYSAYGMVTSVSARRQMTASSWPPGSPPSITDGVESASVAFNYPASGPLSDVPAFTQRTETAVNSPSAVCSYSASTDGAAQTMTFTITRPDSTTMLLTRSTNASSPANGKVVQSEMKNGAATLAKSILTYANDGGGSPQVQSITSYDDTGAPVKVDFDRDQYGNITNRREYGYQVSGAWQVRRRTHLVYTAIGGSKNLVTEADVYDALLNTTDADDVMIAKSDLCLRQLRLDGRDGELWRNGESSRASLMVRREPDGARQRDRRNRVD